MLRWQSPAWKTVQRRGLGLVLELAAHDCHTSTCYCTCVDVSIFCSPANVNTSRQWSKSVLRKWVKCVCVCVCKSVASLWERLLNQMYSYCLSYSWVCPFLFSWRNWLWNGVSFVMHKDWRVQVPAWMLNRCIWICFRRLNTDALPFRHFEVEGFYFSCFDHRNILFGFTRLICDIRVHTLYIYNKTQPHMQLKEMIYYHTSSDALLGPWRDRGWIKKHHSASALTRPT